MFNTSHYRAGDTNIIGVNAPEAARFLRDIQKEAGSSLDSLVFDRLENSDFKMSWAVAVERTDYDGCLNVCIWYKHGHGTNKITLPVIKKDLTSVTDRDNILSAIAKDMSESITRELIRSLFKYV